MEIPRWCKIIVEVDILTQQQINLTQKERMLLQDQKHHEQMCVQKYTNYANQAQDPQLQQLFRDYASKEQQHLDSINQMLNGTVPQIQAQGGQSGQSGQQMNMQAGQSGNQGQSQFNQSTNQTTMTAGSNMGNQGGQQMNMQSGQGGRQNQNSMTNQNDAALCNDVLMTEKYISGTYDTTIFEFSDHNARQLLNHIQKDEQEHGEGIYNYMNQHGMYNPQG